MGNVWAMNLMCLSCIYTVYSVCIHVYTVRGGSGQDMMVGPIIGARSVAKNFSELMIFMIGEANKTTLFIYYLLIHINLSVNQLEQRNMYIQS